MRHLIMGTAGHVDHGKTALIKALTDIECDTHKEEKERGITINLGFSHLDLPSGESIGIVDVPGHKDFIKTMVAGAFGIDIVLLVIAADSGVMPQTIEHLNIIKMLGIKNAIVALNKADLVDEETLELAKEEVEELLKDTNLKNTPIIGVSSITNFGVNELIQLIDQQILNIPEKNKDDFFRLTIDRIFSAKGFGSIVTGSVLNGMIKSGKEVFLLPEFNKVKIRSIQRHGKSVEQAFSGDRAAINLTGLKIDDFKRGMILSDRKVDETKMIDASLSLFENDIQLDLWTNVIFLTGTFECMAKIHLLDKDILKNNETAIVQIHLEKPYILLNKDKFIVRNTSNDITLGGGTIIDVDPLHHKRRTAKLVESLTEFAEATLNSDKLLDLIKLELKKENKPLSLNDISKKIKKPVSEIRDECENDNNQEVIIYKSLDKEILINSLSDKDYYNKVVEIIKQWHIKNPILEEGVDAMAFAGKLGLSSQTGKIYVDELIKKIHNDGIIRKVGNTWALKDHSITIDQKMFEQLEWLENEIKRFEKELPLNSEIEQNAKAKNISKDRLKMMLKYLTKTRKLYFFEGDYIHSKIVDLDRIILLKELNIKERGINEKDFRLLLKCTKKVCQTLLGIFLNEGFVSKETFYIHITEKGRNEIN
ncbi:MAG: selenocysteine-specific translation elongation factor [Bacteroidales bacterium]|nr:selenocysteine-specific translation elongation factor [Bacteroidales bacterium]